MVSKSSFRLDPDRNTYVDSLFMVNPDGCGLQELVKDINGFSFGFAPDGSHIIYSAKAKAGVLLG